MLIIAQWVSAVFACGPQHWNALINSIWLGFCAFSSTYLCYPETAVPDLLKYDCRVSIKRMRAELGSRRSMLSAMA
jgi:hypothetical protein